MGNFVCDLLYCVSRADMAVLLKTAPVFDTTRATGSTTPGLVHNELTDRTTIRALSNPVSGRVASEGEHSCWIYNLSSCCLILPRLERTCQVNPGYVRYIKLLLFSFLSLFYAEFPRVITTSHDQNYRSSFNASPPCANLAQSRFCINSHPNPFFHPLSTD